MLMVSLLIVRAGDMVEFRFKVTYSKGLEVLNRYAPNKKSWKIDSFTGEAWIKITTDENTQHFNDFLLMFLQINEAEDTLKIKDCSTKRSHIFSGDERSTLF